MQKFKHFKKIRVLKGNLKIYYIKEEGEVRMSLTIKGEEASYLRILFRESTVEYHSSTLLKFEGKGYNTMLRQYFHEDLSGTGLVLKNFAFSPASDHILRKLGIPRTADFEKFVKKNKNLAYRDFIEDYGGDCIHEKKF
jgi:hypothetical protein